MDHLTVIVRADWDDEAWVWVATSSDIDGLAIEADTFEKLVERVPGAVADLFELNGLRGNS
jgi:predicted RNase H-like HicB family nuclease